MKLLIIQLSDFHCTERSSASSIKIQKAVDSIVANGSFDKAVIVFSGDLTASAMPNEYKTARRIISSFIGALRKATCCSFIEVLIVPGNHDLYLPKSDRGIKEIQTWTLADHVEDELARLSCFFEYANSQNCFCDNKLVDLRTISFHNKRIQFVLLNSALFSTRAREDKQFHFLPEDALELINSDTSADVRIAVMHHSYEWCEWNTKIELRKEFAQFDLVMFGHDHVPDRIAIQSKHGGALDVLMGGEISFSANDDSSFNTITFDSETNTMSCFEFIWNKNEKLFTSSTSGTIVVAQNRFELTPKAEYLDSLLQDSQHISEKISDYYVFPKLFQRDGNYSDDSHIYTDESIFFSFLEKNRLVGITGSASCGKSTLLKVLYCKSIEHGFLPLYIEKRDYDSRIEKMLRDLFEKQYGENPLGFEKFLQETEKTRIFFIDDFDLIKSDKAKSNLVSYILEHDGVFVYSTKSWAQIDLTDVVKEKIQEKTSCILEVSPFYKEKRDKLASNIFQMVGKSQLGSPDTIISALDYLAQCQASLFSLTPDYLVQYIKYYLSTESYAGKGRETLTVIFETNIRNAIIQNTDAKNVTIYLSALEFVAYEMYFTKRIEEISLEELQTILEAFNHNRRCNIQAKPFISSCKKSNILTESEKEFSYSFSSKNTYAYFVAKRINTALEKNPRDLKDVQLVLSHICFGINDTIVLFLSSLRNNSSIILSIADEASEILSDYPELDFDSNNLPFLKMWQPSQQKMPTKKEAERATENAEALEKRRHDSVKYRRIFDYSEEDVEKDSFRIQRAFRYLQIVSRALVDQYGSLEATEITKIVSALYHLTPKVIYASLKPYQDNYEHIINDLRQFTDRINTEKKLTDDDLKKMLSQAAIVFTLNVMNDIAYNAANCNTIQVLDEVEPPNGNHLIQNLMMFDNAGDSSAFVSRAVELKRQINGNAFVSSLLSRVARKHMVYTPSISHSLVDKLVSANVLSPSSKKAALIEQRRQEQKKK